MNENPTQVLLMEYWHLLEKNSAEAEIFLEANRSNERFYSIVQLEKQIVPVEHIKVETGEWAIDELEEKNRKS